jgi:hypothetical protein
MGQKGASRSGGGYYSGLLNGWTSVNDQALKTWSTAVRHYMGYSTGARSSGSTGSQGTGSGSDPTTEWSSFLDELSQLWSDWLAMWDVNRTVASNPGSGTESFSGPFNSGGATNTGDTPNVAQVVVPAQKGSANLSMTGPLVSGRGAQIDARAVLLTPLSVQAGVATTVVVTLDLSKVPPGTDDVFGGSIEPDNATQPLSWQFSIYVQN